MTLAERPHPFPSRTRKLSSPAPKILRGQPFGKIGRRQDFCVSGGRRPGRALAAVTARSAPRLSFEPMTDDGRARGATPSAPVDAGRRAAGPPVTHLPVPRSSPTAAGGAPSPSREHRCAAVTPPDRRSALEKQRRLCLRPTTRRARRYLAAGEATARRSPRDARVPADRPDDARSSSTAAGSPLADPGASVGPPGDRPGRSSSLLMVARVRGVLIARSPGSRPAGGRCGVGGRDRRRRRAPTLAAADAPTPTADPDAERRAPAPARRRRPSRRRRPTPKPTPRQPATPDLQGQAGRHAERRSPPGSGRPSRRSRSSTGSRIPR